MKKQYIKNPIPPEISEDGGASIMFVNKQTIPLDGAIQEALEGNYCTGQITLIRNFFFGLLQSMADGVRRDGHARQIANFLTVYPVFKGEVDLDKGFDPAVNYVMIRARLLNEMELDITNWSFEDVTEGKRSFTLQSVKAGEVIGEYLLGEVGNINGRNLPSTVADEELRIHWEVEGTDKSGDIPAEKLSSDVSRIDIAEDALAELEDETYDGKTIVFTVRGNFSNAKISAVLKYVQTEPVFTGTDPEDSMTVHNDEDERMTINGLNLPVPTAETPLTEFKLEFFSDTPVFDEPYHFVFNENGSTDPHSIAFDECTSEKLVIKTAGIAHDFQESAMPGGTPVAGTLRLTLGNLVLDQDYTFVKVSS